MLILESWYITEQLTERVRKTNEHQQILLKSDKNFENQPWGYPWADLAGCDTNLPVIKIGPQKEAFILKSKTNFWAFSCP